MNNKKDITKELGTGKILPLVLRLSFPAIIAQLITFLYNIVDRMYVAKIASHGMDALAALGIVLPITLILEAFSSLIGLGGAPRAGIKLGEGKKNEAGKIFNNALFCLLILGVLLGATTFFLSEKLVILFGCPQSSVGFATDYLRIYSLGTVFVMLTQGLNPFILTQGYSLTSMCAVAIGAICNIILDPIFIFTLGMGVKGSSLATILSQGLSCVFVLSFLFSKKSLFHPRLSDMRPVKNYIKSILSLGITPFVMTITECAIQIVFNINLKAATGGNKDYTAALTVMLSALQLISLPLNGLGNGMQPFVSYNYGKGDAERLKKGISLTTLIAFLFCASIWSVSMAMPQIYADLFSASDEVRAIVVRYCPAFLFGSIMFFVQMTLQNINVALGQARNALLLAVTRKVVILIPLCFILTHFLGFYGVYLSEGIADLTAGLITATVIFITFPRIFKKREALVRAQNAEKSDETEVFES